jgi:hypothetical protein
MSWLYLKVGHEQRPHLILATENFEINMTTLIRAFRSTKIESTLAGFHTVQKRGLSSLAMHNIRFRNQMSQPLCVCVTYLHGLSHAETHAAGEGQIGMISQMKG